MLKDNIDTTLSLRLRSRSAALMHRTTHTHTYSTTNMCGNLSSTGLHCLCAHGCACVKGRVIDGEKRGVEDDRPHADARICVLSFPRLRFPSSLCSLFGRDESAPLHSTAAATRRAHYPRAHLFINIYLSISSSSLSLRTILYSFLSVLYSFTIYIMCFSPSLS